MVIIITPWTWLVVGQPFQPDSEPCQAGKPDLLPCRGNNDTPNGLARYQMTVAEELAHIRLHRPLTEAIQGPDDFRKLHSHPQWTEIERNAKKFAAMLLMPTQPLMVEAREVYHQ